jgi:hypothetical protein
VLETLEKLRTVAVHCADTPAWALSDADLTACLDVIHAAEQALAAAKLHLIRQVESRDLPRTQHAHTTAGWLRSRLRVRSGSSRRLVEVATALDRRPALDQAVVTGAVNVEQAQVIDQCLTDLPPEVGSEAVAAAEVKLIEFAAEFDPDQLRSLGKRILLHVAPEVADKVEAAALAREEARAYGSRFLTLRSAGDGKVRLTGLLDTEAAAIVSAALDPLCSPRTATGTLRPTGLTGTTHASIARDAQGAAIDADAVPFDWATGFAGPAHTSGQDRAVIDDRTTGQRRGGDRPQVTVTVAYDTLRAQLGVGTLDTGERLTPTQTRRLACDAQVIPAVLGGDGQVLDVGQSRRLFTGPLRRALVLRDGGCAFPGCSHPPRWTDGHHIVSWIDGGPTTLDNGVLLCRHHHRTIHHSDWQVRLGTDRKPEFIPPAHLDPHQRPRRNAYHHRT